MDKKQYDGESAVQEVARRIGQPTNQTHTSEFKVVYRNGSWEIAMMSQDKEVKSTPLPALNPNGVGY